MNSHGRLSVLLGGLASALAGAAWAGVRPEPMGADATKAPAVEVVLALFLRKPVTTASGVTWTWTDDGLRPGTKGAGPTRSAPWRFEVARGGKTTTLAVDGVYSEGNVLGQLYVLKGAGTGRVRVRVHAGEAKPLSHEEGRALAERHVADKMPGAGSSAGWVALPNGTLRVSWTSALDGGEVLALVVGLYSREIVGAE